MKRPDEIKKGLECRVMGYNEKCSRKCDACAVYVPSYSISNIYADALAYIQQLETENHQLKLERDALLDQLKQANIMCDYCKHYDIMHNVCNCDCSFCYYTGNCPCRECNNNSHWEWKGIKEDNP